MKRILYVFAILSFLFVSAHSTPTDVRGGSWEYDVLVNGILVGKSTISSTITNGQHVHQSDMTMTIGQVSTTTKQKVTETEKYTPVKFEISVVTIYGTNKTTMETMATFDGKKVTLKTGESVQTFTITRPFVLDGNYFYSELVKNKFVKDSEASAYLYHPSIEAREPFKVTVKVLGKETVLIRDKQKNLIHVAFFMETIKQADYYLNDDGAAERIEQRFMNNTVELILK